tara:strand:- start:122 stop:244 length:123 start_codon:yes stop_codon:yes gene_type:complete
VAVVLVAAVAVANKVFLVDLVHILEKPCNTHKFKVDGVTS